MRPQVSGSHCVHISLHICKRLPFQSTRQSATSFLLCVCVFLRLLFLLFEVFGVALGCFFGFCIFLLFEVLFNKVFCLTRFYCCFCLFCCCLFCLEFVSFDCLICSCLLVLYTRFCFAMLKNILTRKNYCLIDWLNQILIPAQ